jgi:hypothetical protein
MRKMSEKGNANKAQTINQNALVLGSIVSGLSGGKRLKNWPLPG